MFLPKTLTGKHFSTPAGVLSGIFDGIPAGNALNLNPGPLHGSVALLEYLLTALVGFFEKTLLTLWAKHCSLPSIGSNGP